MADLTPAEAAIFHTYGQEDLDRTRRIVAAVRLHIEAELRVRVSAEIRTHEAVYYCRDVCGSCEVCTHLGRGRDALRAAARMVEGAGGE